jgi:hypothetical protein
MSMAGFKLSVATSGRGDFWENFFPTLSQVPVGPLTDAKIAFAGKR